MPFKNRILLVVVVVLAVVMTFWKLGSHDLCEWDESRYGVNAFEMLHNHDYINLYYDGAPDTWIAKPPLMIWLIVASYKLFGLNEFALRFPAAVSAVLFFIVFFRIVERWSGRRLAFLSCLILLSCKAILSEHIGITGDMDALLLLFLALSAFYFIEFIETHKSLSIYLVALFTGLAFYTKGPASLLFLPGFVLYAILRNRAGPLFRNKHTWFASGLFLMIAGSWVLLLLRYGLHYSESVYGSKSALQTMLIDDTFRRMTSSDFEPDYQKSWGFVFGALDARLNLWNYLFYASLVIGLRMLYRARKHLMQFIRRDEHRLQLFASCVTFPLFLLLTLAANPHDWYLAPVFGFVAFLTASGIASIGNIWSPAYLAAALLFIFCFCRQLYNIWSYPTGLHDAISAKNAYIRACDKVVLTENPRQHLKLYLTWLGKPVVIPGIRELSIIPASILIVEKKALNNSVPPGFQPLASSNVYSIGKLSSDE